MLKKGLMQLMLLILLDLIFVERILPRIIRSDEPLLFVSPEYFEIPEVLVKVDYRPKRLDAKSLVTDPKNNTMELMNFFPLEGIELRVKSLTLAGVSSLQSLALRICHD